MSSPNETDFVTALAAGQRDLWAFILSVVPSQSDCEDILQEVNLALWGKRDLYNGDKKFLPWALGFTVIEIQRYRTRSAKNRLWFSDEAIASIATEWSEPDPFVEGSRHALDNCVHKLREAERLVIEAKYRKDMSVKEIADNLGLSSSAIYKTLSRALRALKECVKRSQMQADR